MAAFAVEPIRAACQMVSCDTGFIDGIQCRMHNYTHGTVLAVHKQCNVFVNAYLWNLFGCIVLSPAERHGDNTAIGQSDACTFFVFNRIAYSSKSGANAAGKFDCKAVFYVRNYTKRTGWLLPFPGSIDPACFRKR